MNLADVLMKAGIFGLALVCLAISAWYGHGAVTDHRWFRWYRIKVCAAFGAAAAVLAWVAWQA